MFLNYFYFLFMILLLIVLSTYIFCLMITQLILTVLALLLAPLSQWAYLGGTPVLNLLILIVLTSPSLFLYYSIQQAMPIIYILLIGTSLYHITKDIKKTKKSSRKYQMNYDLIAIGVPVASSGVLFGVSKSKNYVGFDD